VLEALGRFGDETPDKLNIELCNGEYRALGDSAAYAREAAMSTVVEVLPATPDKAIETRDVVTRAADKGCARSATIDALNRLTEAETVIRLGAGKRGDAYRYYKPIPGDEDATKDTNFDSFETPPLRPNESNSASVTDTYRGNGNGNGSTDPTNEREIQKLVYEGMSEKAARDEVYRGCDG